MLGTARAGTWDAARATRSRFRLPVSPVDGDGDGTP